MVPGAATGDDADPKDDEIPLLGVARSFFVLPLGGHYVLVHEIFHL